MLVYARDSTPCQKTSPPADLLLASPIAMSVLCLVLHNKKKNAPPNPSP